MHMAKPFDWRSYLDEIEDLAAQGLTEEQIISCLPIQKTTYFKYKAEQPEFSDAIKRGQHKGIKLVTNALMQNALKGNLGAQVFYLKNRSKGSWKENPDQGLEKTAQEIAKEITKSIASMDPLLDGTDNDALDKKVGASDPSEGSPS